MDGESGCWSGWILQLCSWEAFGEVTPVWHLPSASSWLESTGSVHHPWWNRTGPSPMMCTEAGHHNTLLLFSSPGSQRERRFNTAECCLRVLLLWLWQTCNTADTNFKKKKSNSFCNAYYIKYMFKSHCSIYIIVILY